MVSKPSSLSVLQINCCTAKSSSVSVAHCSVQQQKEQGMTAKYLTESKFLQIWNPLCVPKQPPATVRSSAVDTGVRVKVLRSQAPGHRRGGSISQHFAAAQKSI